MSDQVIQDFNIGKDATVMFKFPSGQVISGVQLAHIESVSVKRLQKMTEKTPMTNNGDTLRRSHPQGYELTMKCTRYNGNLTEVFTQMDENYRNSGLPQRFDVNITVRNPDGTLNQGTFTNCVFENFGFGDFEGIDAVSQDVSMKAQRYVKTK